jgi:histidine triad (HIT) family protein
MSDCLFCKIVAGEVSSTRVVEEEKTLAFMDIMPARKGHVLVVPKVHSANMTEVAEEDLLAVMRLVRRLAVAVDEAIKPAGFSVVQLNGEASGQTVFHMHFHIIPRRDGDGIKMKWSREEYGSGEIEQYRDRIVKVLEPS